MVTILSLLFTTGTFMKQRVYELFLVLPYCNSDIYFSDGRISLKSCLQIFVKFEDLFTVIYNSQRFCNAPTTAVHLRVYLMCLSLIHI